MLPIRFQQSGFSVRNEKEKKKKWDGNISYIYPGDGAQRFVDPFVPLAGLGV